MEFETIQRSTTPLMIVEQIQKSLETGKLKPGDKLPPERELSKMFGVGRSSVREAIRALVVMGYLEVIQGKGTFLCKDLPTNGHSTSQLEHVLAAEPLFDLMEARQILECKVVKLAAERAEQKHIRRMHKAVARMERSGEDIKSFYEADLNFHYALAEAADNVVITEIMKLIIEKVHQHNVKFMATSLGTKEKTIQTAREIVSLVAEGAGDEAARYILEHLSVVDAKLKDVVSK